MYPSEKALDKSRLTVTLEMLTLLPVLSDVAVAFASPHNRAFHGLT